MKASRLSLDRISSLPPPITENILCFLPIREAVRTSVLSKEWRYSWTKIPKLVFDKDTFKVLTEEDQPSIMEQTFHKRSDRKTISDKCKFFYAIYQVLILHQGPIPEFITHLVKKITVMKLTLELNNLYKLPRSIYSLQLLMDLTLMYCDIHHQPPLNGFASLTRLCLMDVKVTNKSFLYLISSCPKLKCFELHTGYSSDSFDYDGEVAALPKLLECLHVVVQLTFSLYERLSYAESETVLPQELPTLFVHLKYFCLEYMFFDKYWMRFLALMMRSSPNLEKIEILTPEIDSMALEDFSVIRLEHLNELVIGDFRYLRVNLELVKLILAKSPVLKKVKILLCNEISKDEELNECKILLPSARASPLVNIIVERVTGRS